MDQCKQTPSVFDQWQGEPPDAIFGAARLAQEDTNPAKVDLTIGAYRSAQGKPFVFQSVEPFEPRATNKKPTLSVVACVISRAVKDTWMRLATPELTHEYLAPVGLPKLAKQAHSSSEKTAVPYAKGELRLFKYYRQVFGRGGLMQTVSGTGALSIAAHFFKRVVWKSQKFGAVDQPLPVVYIGNPSWTNYKQIFSIPGYEIRHYPYLCPSQRNLDLEGMLQTLRIAAAGSLIVLQACGHNPTGVDPTTVQWDRIVEALQTARLIPLIDVAYQGVVTGNLEEDAYIVRKLVETNMEFFVAQSFSKNMGIYGERVGALHIVASCSSAVEKLKHTAGQISRGLYSNPPAFSGRVVESILDSPELRSSWLEELHSVALRIRTIREQLVTKLEKKKGACRLAKGLATHRGMFSLISLDPDQCQRLRTEWHIHVVTSGRINIAALTQENMDYVVRAFDAVIS